MIWKSHTNPNFLCSSSDLRTRFTSFFDKRSYREKFHVVCCTSVFKSDIIGVSCCKFWINWVGVNTKFTTWQFKIYNMTDVLKAYIQSIMSHKRFCRLHTSSFHDQFKLLFIENVSFLLRMHESFGSILCSTLTAAYFYQIIKWTCKTIKVVWDTLQYLLGWKDSKLWLQPVLEISKSMIFAPKIHKRDTK